MCPLLQANDCGSAVTAARRSAVFSLGRQYWIFFTSAFFFDAGFAVYFFLFNLYLLDAHWNERTIGLVGGAFTLGSLLGTLPGGELVRRFGVRSILFGCFLSAPLLGVIRVLWLVDSVQVLCALLAGAAMSLWGVSYLPTIARIAPPRRRPAAYSLIFTASLVTSGVGSLLCGFLPSWIAQRGVPLSPVRFDRAVLVCSCVVAMLAAVPLLRLRVPSPEPLDSVASARLSGWHVNSFLRRYLMCMALWAAVLAAFSPFANVYLAHERHVPLRTISLLFANVQVLQLLLGLVLPYLLKVLGVQCGLLSIQLCAGLTLAVLAFAPTGPIFLAAYIGFSAAQWMSFPTLYSTAMNSTPANQHHSTAALIMCVNALLGAVATPLAGAAFVQFGYKPILLVIATVAAATAVLFYRLGAAPAMEQTPCPLVPAETRGGDMDTVSSHPCGTR